MGCPNVSSMHLSHLRFPSQLSATWVIWVLYALPTPWVVWPKPTHQPFQEPPKRTQQRHQNQRTCLNSLNGLQSCIKAGCSTHGCACTDSYWFLDLMMDAAAMSLHVCSLPPRIMRPLGNIFWCSLHKSLPIASLATSSGHPQKPLKSSAKVYRSIHRINMYKYHQSVTVQYTLHIFTSFRRFRRFRRQKRRVSRPSRCIDRFHRTHHGHEHRNAPRAARRRGSQCHWMANRLRYPHRIQPEKAKMVERKIDVDLVPASFMCFEKYEFRYSWKLRNLKRRKINIPYIYIYISYIYSIIYIYIYILYIYTMLRWTR